MVTFFKGKKIDTKYLRYPNKSYLRFFYKKTTTRVVLFFAGLTKLKYDYVPVNESKKIFSVEKNCKIERSANLKKVNSIKHKKDYLGFINSYTEQVERQSKLKKDLLNKYNMNYISHPWNIVNPSPWPFISGFSAFFFLIGLIAFLYGYGNFQLKLGFLSLLFSFILWNRDIIREGTFHGKHTTHVKTCLKTGFKYFIISELMLFISFFWAFHNFYLNGSVETSYIYPPVGIHMDDQLPGVMNMILILSGAIITYSHIHSKLKLNLYHIWPIKRYMFLTIFLGFIFICLQIYEYCHNSFTFSDSSLGSIFYLLTGCHSLHVIIGVTFLIVSFIRDYKRHTTLDHNLNYILSVWYWHFVDAIWIFVYLKLYYLFHFIKKTQNLYMHYNMYDISGGSMYLDYPLGLIRLGFDLNTWI